MPEIDQKAKALAKGTGLEEKIKKALQVIDQAAERFGDQIAIAWTAGKDATLLLYLVKEYYGKIPFDVLFIDTGQYFPESYQFKSKLVKEWDIDLIETKNEEVLEKAENKLVRIKDLEEMNRNELKKINWNKDFKIGEDKKPCCHLLKKVATKQAIEENGWKALIVALRWDEPDVDPTETHFSTKQDYIQVSPILHFTEKDVWKLTLANQIPHNPLYEKGYRSINCQGCIEPAGKGNAWELLEEED